MEATTQLRPKLKQDSIFLPSNDGVLFRNGGNVFFLKGASVYRWVSSLAPHLDGEHTLEELCHSLDPGRREMVTRLVHTLWQKGIVKDHIPEDPATLPAAVRERFAPQIELIDHYVDRPVARFKDFRRSRVLVAGSGKPFRALAVALARNGLETLSLAPTAEAEDDWRAVEAEVAALGWDGSDAAPRLVRADAALSGEGLARYQVVAYCSDEGSLRDVYLLNRRCFGAGVTFLPGVVFGGRSMVGPLVRPGVAGCWECALLRLSANLEEGDAASLWKRVALGGPPAEEALAAFSAPARMLGNSVAFELFKALAGHQRPESEGGVLLQDLETLESSRPSLLPHPLCAVCARPDAASEAALLEEIVARRHDRVLAADEQLQGWYPHLDPHVGMLHSFADEELEQIPLRTTLLVVGHPAEPAAGPFRVTARSVESTASARRQALAEAVRRYARASLDPRRMLTGSYDELFERGEEPVAPQELSLWSGTQTFDPNAHAAWLPAYSLREKRLRHVPAQAVYPDSRLNREGAFERTAAGTGVGLTYEEALADGLLSALCFERLWDVLKGSARVASLDARRLGGHDTDLAYLLTTLERLGSPVQVLELVGELPVRVVLARAEGGGVWGGEIVRVGCALSRVEAVKQSLAGVAGEIQDRSAAGAAPKANSYTSGLPFARFSLPPDAAVTPLESLRYEEAPARPEGLKQMLLGGGRDVLFVNITPSDVLRTETFICGAVLLTG